MKLVIQICAELEWESTKNILKATRDRLRRQPFGEYFQHTVGKQETLIYESGATKTRSAAACQFAIDKWHPDAVFNLGTCGGVAKSLGKGALIVADKTIQYDVMQKFGKPSSRFKRGLQTDLDLSWIDLSGSSKRLSVGTIASADQDLDHDQRQLLQRKGILAADWESASIATICRLNKTRCLILRGISDIPHEKEDPMACQQELDYARNTEVIMKELFSVIGQFRIHTQE